MAKRELKTPPEPVQVDSRRVVLAGTVLWFVGFVALLAVLRMARPARPSRLALDVPGRLDPRLIGLVLVRKHRAKAERAEPSR